MAMGQHQETFVDIPLSGQATWWTRGEQVLTHPHNSIRPPVDPLHPWNTRPATPNGAAPAAPAAAPAPAVA